MFYVYCTLPRDYLLFFWQVGVFSKGMIKLWQESLKERNSIQFFTPMSAFSSNNTRKPNSFCCFKELWLNSYWVKYLATALFKIWREEKWREDADSQFWPERGWSKMAVGWNAGKAGMIFKIRLIPNSCKITILVEIGFTKHLSRSAKDGLNSQDPKKCNEDSQHFLPLLDYYSIDSFYSQ